MYVKVEPTGCCERNGLLQIRFSFYLDPNDKNYLCHFVQVKDEWQNNPAHNHFVYMEPTITDQELLDMGEGLLRQWKQKWDDKPESLDLHNPPVVRLNAVFPQVKQRTSQRLAAINKRLGELTNLERHI